MILAAILAACQGFLGQNPDRIRIFKRGFIQDLPRNPGKCTIVRISRPEGTEIMNGQNFSPNKTGTLAAWVERAPGQHALHGQWSLQPCAHALAPRPHTCTSPLPTPWPHAHAGPVPSHTCLPHITIASKAITYQLLPLVLKQALLACHTRRMESPNCPFVCGHPQLHYCTPGQTRFIRNS